MRSSWSVGLSVGLLMASVACSSETPEPGGGRDIDKDPVQAPDGGRDGGPSKRDGGPDARAIDPDADGGLDDIEPVVIDSCKPGNGIDEAQVEALKQGGEAGDLRFTYPYDGTVFPRGLEAPTIAWTGADASELVYVHIKSRAFEYHGCTLASGANELLLDQNAWEIAGAQTYGKRDPFTVEITVSSGGKIRGPIAQTWTIARATIKGSVYYNSYFSIGGGGLIGGKVFRIPPGKKAEGFLTLECNGCHSVSANGARMTSQTLGLGARAYDINSGAPAAKPAPNNNAYSALYPDGSRYLVGSQVIDVGRANVASPLSVASKATLYDTDTGAVLQASGIPADTLMPSFSPDGTLLVFNDYAIDNAHGLAALDYDGPNNTATNYRELVRTQGLRRPGWPFALPDNAGVVYVETESLDFSAYGAGVGVSATAIIAPYSDLKLVDVDSGQTTLLARAMGFADEQAAAQNQTYLPFGAEETHKNYFPTVSPVAAGGYFWVFWDSIRHYGNRGLSRQLWGTAIEISAEGDYSVDRSAPAFYLPGQEFGTGNHRAFTALDPCKEDGDSCESGVDCCGGSCDKASGAGVCKPVEGCAKSEERCDSDDDCCPVEPGKRRDVCLGGYCSTTII